MLDRKGLNKRGFAIQFNWLFVLIGGAIILGFFFSIITNQVYEGEKKTAQRSTQELDALLKVSLASGDTQKTVVFDKKIVFYCDEISEYYVEGAVKPSRYDYNAIFSPSELESKELIIQTLAFEAPSRVMPIVYVTNKDVEYVFVGDSTLITHIYNAMPDSTIKKSINFATNPDALSTYPDNNYDHTVFVLNITDETRLRLTSLDNFVNPDGRAYAVVITPGPYPLVDPGELTFYHYDSSSLVYPFINDGSVLFLNPELVLGGVISHDKTIYNCTLRKVLRRLELLSKLHKERMIYYADNAAEYCKSVYSSANNSFENITFYAGKEPPSVDDFKNISQSIDDLRDLNDYLLTETDCPRIY